MTGVVESLSSEPGWLSMSRPSLHCDFIGEKTKLKKKNRQERSAGPRMKVPQDHLKSKPTCDDSDKEFISMFAVGGLSAEKPQLQLGTRCCPTSVFFGSQMKPTSSTNSHWCN